MVGLYVLLPLPSVMPLQFACISVHIIISKILLILWCSVLLQKLTGMQLVKKFPAFYGTRRSSPCFKPFLIGNLSDTFLPTRTLIYVALRLIFTNLTNFLGIPNSMRILHKTSLLTES
jgi:hypothetical protein